MSQRGGPRVTTRYTEEEHRQVAAAAALEGVSPGVFVKRRALEAAQRTVPVRRSGEDSRAGDARTSLRAVPPAIRSAGGTPASSKVTLVRAVQEQVGSASLALRALRQGQVTVSGQVARDPQRVVDPSSVRVA